MKCLSLQEVQRFITLGGKINKLYHKTTLLCEASRKGDLEVTKKLLSIGADVNMPDIHGCSPIFLAASHGHKAVMELLLKKGAEVNVKNTNGFTPLVSTIQNSHNECAKILIENGACVNIDRPKNIFGAKVSLLTYILFAKGDWEMADYLLKAGIRPTKFIPPLGFILLEDPTTPMSLIKKFVYAGFDVHMSGWVDLIQRRGDELTDSQKQLVELLEHEQKNAPSLQRLCRTVIRSELSKEHFESNLHMFRKIEQLPLPLEVMRYVKLEHL